MVKHKKKIPSFIYIQIDSSISFTRERKQTKKNLKAKCINGFAFITYFYSCTIWTYTLLRATAIDQARKTTNQTAGRFENSNSNFEAASDPRETCHRINWSSWLIVWYESPTICDRFLEGSKNTQRNLHQVGINRNYVFQKDLVPKRDEINPHWNQPLAIVRARNLRTMWLYGAFFLLFLHIKVCNLLRLVEI